MLLYRGNETLKGATGAMSRAMDKSKTRPNYKRTTLDFTITQDDIDKGLPNNPSSCPAAIALQRDGLTVSVFREYITFYASDADKFQGKIQGYSLTSPRLKYWSSNFDKGAQSHPADFRIKYPPQFPSTS